MEIASIADRFWTAEAIIRDFEGRRLPEELQQLLFHRWEIDAVEAYLDGGASVDECVIMYAVGLDAQERRRA